MSELQIKQGIDYTGVTIIFFCHDGRGNFLFNRRGQSCRDEHGKWDPGGGGLDFGESIEGTLEREIKEEYCTEVLDTEFLGYRDVHRVDEEGNQTHWLALDFKVLVDRDMVQNGEPEKFDEIGWFDLDHLPEPMHSQWPEASKRYLLMLRAKQELEQPIGSCVIVQNEQGQVLLGKRKNAYRSGEYGLPGGRVNGSEQAIDAARRELKEETGLEADDLKYIGVVKEWQSSYNFIHFVYLCDQYSGEPMVVEPEKCEAWKWFDLDQLPDQILPGHLQAIEMLQDKSQMKDC